ncbi:hypothetical protein [Parvularcula marina]|uniref:Heparinase n=1 Tax=Parvularcula marina TaxID=2292771 RepID=A0A371RK21_9PROT|nr:hypothetical protein [Parvularcula marina]RFB05798.1 hypothetical protein DX908_11280 [Parvularcula marina]
MSKRPRESGRARFYHDVQLRGPIPQRLVFYPEVSAAPSEALIEAARAWTAEDDMSPGSLAAAESFHRFDWLPILAGAGEDGAEAIRKLTAFWLEQHGRFSPATWRATLCAPRVIRMLCHMDLLTNGMDGPMRAMILDSTARQARHLSRFLRRGKDKQRLPVVVARTLASLCLPEDRQIGTTDTPRLGQYLRPLAEGELPASWRHVNVALQETDDLFILSEAFDIRRLSAPPELDEALKVARLYIGGFLTGEGGMVQMPGRYAPDKAALHRIGPMIRPESAILLERMGYASLRDGDTLFMADLGKDQDLAGTGGIALTTGRTPLIVSCGAPSPAAIGIVDRMAAWADALNTPAAASGFDIPALAPSSFSRPSAQEMGLSWSSRRGTIQRKFELSESEHQLSVEEQIPTEKLDLRLHIGAGQAKLDEHGGVDIALDQGAGARLTIDGAKTQIEESVSAWPDGRIEKLYQIVMSPCGPAVRWRIKWGQ